MFIKSSAITNKVVATAIRYLFDLSCVGSQGAISLSQRTQGPRPTYGQFGNANHYLGKTSEAQRERTKLHGKQTGHEIQIPNPGGTRHQC